MVRSSDRAGGGSGGGSTLNARLASGGRDLGSGIVGTGAGCDWSACVSGASSASRLSMRPNSVSKSIRAERVAGREGYLIDGELRAEPDPNRSSNENVPALLVACGFRSQATTSKSTTQAASAAVTTSMAIAQAALPTHGRPRLETSPAAFVVL
jgi:hypothetical protein